MSDALTVEGHVLVRCTREEAWDLFSRFSDVAALIPSVQEVEVDGEHIHARVETRLGALPVSSRVTLQVIERRSFECIKAEGLSYLGETIKEQIKKDVAGVAKDSVGRLLMHLDLRASEREGHVAIFYNVEVEAKGRLKRIYRAILKTKVPGMMEEFADNIRGALEVEQPAATAEVVVALAGGVEIPARALEVETDALTPLAKGLWARLMAWLRALFATRRTR